MPDGWQIIVAALVLSAVDNAPALKRSTVPFSPPVSMLQIPSKHLANRGLDGLVPKANCQHVLSALGGACRGTAVPVQSAMRCWGAMRPSTAALWSTSGGPQLSDMH